MKKNKCLIIGSLTTIFLMLSVTTLVPVSAHEFEEDPYFQELDMIIGNYTEPIEEYDKYINDYINEYGGIDENFTVSVEIAEELNNLMTEISEIQSQQPQSGGVNDFDIWWEFIIFCHAVLKIDHFWTTLLDVWGTLGLSLTVIILSSLSLFRLLSRICLTIGKASASMNG